MELIRAASGIFYSPVTDHHSLIQRRIVRRRGQHFVPGPQPAHDFEPKLRQTGRRQRGACRLLQDPGFLLHLGLELARAPTGIADKCPDRGRIRADALVRFVHPYVVIELEPFAGQLEAEMKQKAWIVQRPTRAALTPERLPKLWFEIMRGLGPWYKMLAAAPDDPSLN